MTASVKSKLALMSAAASLSAVLLVGSLGCDAVESGEGQASRKTNAAADQATMAMNLGDAGGAVAKMGTVTADAGAAAKARAYCILAEADFARAQPLLAELDGASVKAATMGWEIDQLLTRMRSATTTAKAFGARDPQEVRAETTKTIKEIQGGANGAVWKDDPNGDGDVPTLSAVTQRISKLEGEIAQRKEKIGQLVDQRKKIGAEAQTLVEKSNQTQGQAGVDQFRRATQMRQQANSVGIQIEGVNAELIPLNNDLAVAQAQKAALERAVGRLQKQDEAVAEGWKKVGSEIDGQNQLAQTILNSVSGPTGEGFEADRVPSVQAKLKALQGLIADSSPTFDQAKQYLSDAAQQASSAATAAQTLGTQVQAKGRTLSESAPAFEAMQKANDPNSLRLLELEVRRTLASTLANRASMLATAENAQTRLVQLAGETKLQLPQGLVDAQLGAAATEMRQSAMAAFDEAVNLAATVKEAGGATPDQKNAAQVASVITRYAWSISARSAGDVQTADAQLATAKQEATEAVGDNALFPALPKELNIPTRQVAQETMAPAPAPTEAGEATPVATPSVETPSVEQ